MPKSISWQKNRIDEPCLFLLFQVPVNLEGAPDIVVKQRKDTTARDAILGPFFMSVTHTRTYTYIYIYTFFEAMIFLIEELGATID